MPITDHITEITFTLESISGLTSNNNTMVFFPNEKGSHKIFFFSGIAIKRGGESKGRVTKKKKHFLKLIFDQKKVPIATYLKGGGGG